MLNFLKRRLFVVMLGLSVLLLPILLRLLLSMLPCGLGLLLFGVVLFFALVLRTGWPRDSEKQ